MQRLPIAGYGLMGMLLLTGSALIGARVINGPVSVDPSQTEMGKHLDAFGFLVGGTWESRDTLRLVGTTPFQPAVEYAWVVPRQLLRVTSWRRGLDGVSVINNAGFYYWRTEDSVAGRVLVFPDGARIEGEYESMVDGRLRSPFTFHPVDRPPVQWRSEIIRIGTDEIREVSERWNGEAWIRATDLTFTRAQASRPPSEG